MISIGPVIITAISMPEQIPIGGTLDATDKKLSDGSRILKITGFTPQDFQLTGTLLPLLGPDSAIRAFEQLEQMARSHLPQIFVWAGEKVRRSFPVIVQTVTGSIHGANEVDYNITLFRQTNTGLVAGGYVLSKAHRASNLSSSLRRVSSRVGTQTGTAINAALLAQAAVSHRGN